MEHARSTKTAYEAFEEKNGVCRDFAHLAITLCRCLNIPARYATGYLGDIGVPASPLPMDFSAWFEAYLGGRWYTFDARHNKPRIGRDRHGPRARRRRRGPDDDVRADDPDEVRGLDRRGRRPRVMMEGADEAGRRFCRGTEGLRRDPCGRLHDRRRGRVSDHPPRDPGSPPARARDHARGVRERGRRGDERAVPVADRDRHARLLDPLRRPRPPRQTPTRRDRRGGQRRQPDRRGGHSPVLALGRPVAHAQTALLRTGRQLPPARARADHLRLSRPRRHPRPRGRHRRHEPRRARGFPSCSLSPATRRSGSGSTRASAAIAPSSSRGSR